MQVRSARADDLVPPAHAVVLLVDEKSQIQALDRTQPALLMKKGRGGTMTHDYKRKGTTTLFAALNVLDRSVIGKLTQCRLQRGVFHSLVDLQAAINRFIKEHNATEAKPFRWIADPDRIIAARNRGLQTLYSIHEAV